MYNNNVLITSQFKTAHVHTKSNLARSDPLPYDAPFKTKCHQCFRNLYRTSNIYISVVRYLYPTSGYLYPISGYLYPISGYLYPMSDIYIYWSSDIYIRRPIHNNQLRLGQELGLYEAPFKTICHQFFRNLYRTSNIYIGRPISISDVRYPYPSPSPSPCPSRSRVLYIGSC